MRINVLLNLLLVTGFQTASLPALAQTSDAIDLLIERIEQAEAAGRNYHRDRLIEQLQRTAPNHPRAIEFRLIDALASNDLPRAQQLLDELQKSQPNGDAAQRSRERIRLAQPPYQSLIAQARLNMLTGKTDIARTLYQQVYQQEPRLEPYRSDWRELERLAQQSVEEPVVVEVETESSTPNEAETTPKARRTRTVTYSPIVSDSGTAARSATTLSTAPAVTVATDSSNAVNSELKNQGPYLTVGFLRNERDSVDGNTSFASDTLLLEYRRPTETGIWTFKVDGFVTEAGEFDLTNTFQKDRFGTGLLCQTAACNQGLLPNLKENGASIGIAFDSDIWHADIGLSPIGFDKTELLGGLEYSGDLGEFGWSLGIERRIETTSVLTFSGQQDPFSSRHWGPVVRQGVGGSLNWDQGGLMGWWSNFGVNHYGGRNVDSNKQWYAYTGVYFRIIDTEAFAFTSGLTALSWGFDKNRGETTFGHGGYYSPAHYASLSLPIEFYGRIDRFSYILRASFGQSTSRLDDAEFYPTSNLLQQQAGNPIHTGNPDGGGFGRSFRAAFEYRITNHWSVGLNAQIERSEFYTPNNYQLYFRYHFNGDGNAFRPPNPPSRYVDF
ncbi:cellulose synthase subunit BcsC-related outer membrane protein [Idiomarina sp.]|uniref:cellulose synthase subunit BcsC-related outer membrane protein n=1 Tax=Idiomarina sp. TaxID=1874361 RepID=UPI002EC2D45E|nr:cellulose synthase subunit BcsC-related outer membrane protein [Pseudomonadota bacterium]